MTANRSSLVVYGAILILLYPSIIGVIQVSNAIVAPESDDFPTSCDESYKCSRLAPNPHRSTGETELRFSNTSIFLISNSINSWISDNQFNQEVSRNEGIKLEIHIIVKTKWMRFADDVFVHVECDGDDAVVWIHSESRVGISDVGLNEKRINDIRDQLMDLPVGDTPCS